MKILHLDSTHSYLYQNLENLGFTNKFDFESSKDQIEIKISSYHGIIIRSRIPIDKSLINKATNLKFIARVGSGTENIDIKHAEKKKINVIS
jgi:D-3-phosphoglycerate dehydrogenase